MQALIAEAQNHRAVHHPYLLALRSGEFKRMDLVLRDFALQYGAYSAWFPRYLTAVIAKLEDPKHRLYLLDNLAEESGRLDEHAIAAIESLGIHKEWVDGIAHPLLFERFQNAIGVERSEPIGIEVQIWRESFLGLVQHTSAASAVGAIGLGTESIVKDIYRHFIDAIETHTSLTLREYAFFPLHTEVDDEHGVILLQIAEELASTSEDAHEDLRKGMLKALNLRASFWDDMYARAKAIDESGLMPANDELHRDMAKA